MANAQVQLPQSKKGIMTRISESLGMKIWLTSPCIPPKPVAVMDENEEHLEYAVGKKEERIVVALGLFSHGPYPSSR